jgi:RNA polymerase sigma-70 factor (ECF subfamily)
MLGSLHEADDALQETMLRAWKGSDRYEPRAQLGAWLHTIATNVCLTAIAHRRSQPAQLMEDLEHLQPYPDRLLDDLVVRETVELAFIMAIQLLPPKQRAVLILRDVLGWSAKEVAEALEDSVGAVTSALQRARTSPKRARRHASAAIGDFFAAVPQEGRLDEIRLLPTAVNRQPALAAYARGHDGKHHAYGLMVLHVDAHLISGIVGFPDPWLFEQCALPSELT